MHLPSWPEEGPRRGWSSVLERSEARRAVAVFLLTGLLTLAVVAVPSALAMRHLTRDHTLTELRERTTVMAQRLVGPRLDAAALRGDPAALARVDRAVHARIADGTVDRVTVWTTDGRVVYSTDDDLMGRSFPEHDWGSGLLVRGETEAVFEDTGQATAAYEPAHGRFVEVDAIYTLADGERVVFEVYYPASTVHDQQRDLLLRLLPVGLGTLLVLQLAQLPLAARLAGRIQALDRGRRRLLEQTAAASDLERRRIAAELHDDVLQDLAGVAYALESVTRSSAPPDPELVDRARVLVRGSVARLRGLLADVYPADVARIGVRRALEGLADRGREAGLDVDLDVPPEPDVDPVTATLLYRVARESVTNVLKHAGARTLSIRLQPGSREVLLEVSDDGHGFDAADASDHGHVGLLLLRDTLTEAGGRIDVDSALGQGTTVRATIPVL